MKGVGKSERQERRSGTEQLFWSSEEYLSLYSDLVVSGLSRCGLIYSH